jgi:hypothetical protein
MGWSVSQVIVKKARLEHGYLGRVGIIMGHTALLTMSPYYPGTKETHVGQAFQPDSELCQAGKPDLLPCRGNTRDW